MPNPSMSRVLRPAFALLAVLLAGTLLVGCGHRGAGIKNADQPKAVKNALDGVWTLTLNPDVVRQGGQSRNVSLSLATKRTNADGGTLDGSINKTPFSDGKFMTGGELSVPKIEFTSGDVRVPEQGDETGMVVSGPLQWKATLVDDDTLTGTVTGSGATGQSQDWTAKKN